MLVMTNYAKNYASTIYESLCDGLRHDQNSTRVYRFQTSHGQDIKGKYVKC